MNIQKSKYYITISLLVSSVYGQGPPTQDYYRTAGELGVFLYLQYGLHTDISDLVDTSDILNGVFDTVCCVD